MPDFGMFSPRSNTFVASGPRGLPSWFVTNTIPTIAKPAGTIAFARSGLFAWQNVNGLATGWHLISAPLAGQCFAVSMTIAYTAFLGEAGFVATKPLVGPAIVAGTYLVSAYAHTNQAWAGAGMGNVDIVIGDTSIVPTDGLITTFDGSLTTTGGNFGTVALGLSITGPTVTVDAHAPLSGLTAGSAKVELICRMVP